MTTTSSGYRLIRLWNEDVNDMEEKIRTPDRIQLMPLAEKVKALGEMHI